MIAEWKMSKVNIKNHLEKGESIRSIESDNIGSPFEIYWIRTKQFAWPMLFKHSIFGCFIKMRVSFFFVSNNENGSKINKTKQNRRFQGVTARFYEFNSSLFFNKELLENLPLQWTIKKRKRKCNLRSSHFIEFITKTRVI